VKEVVVISADVENTLHCNVTMLAPLSLSLL